MALITLKKNSLPQSLPYWKFTMKSAKHTKAIKIRLTEQEHQTLKKQEKRTNYDHSTKSTKIEA